MSKNKSYSLLYLLTGAGLFTLVTWRWNVALAAWLAPVFLMRFFRHEKRWYGLLGGVLLLWAASFANKTGAWDMDRSLEVAAALLAALPMILALTLDRFTRPRFTRQRIDGLWQTLVFPAAYVSLDYAISQLPLGLGTVFTLAPSQFYNTPLVQAASLTGIWGIEFLVLWAAPVANAWWEHGFDLGAMRGSPRGAVRVPVIVYGAVLALALLYGGIRQVVERPAAPTVRVAGVTVAHARDYWGEIIDVGTPVDKAQALSGEMLALEDRLFALSEQAVRSGAQVIFWSEANAFVLPERQEAFFDRARDFSRQNRVYLMPAYQILRYGDTSGENGLAMITPEGEVAYRYEKTMSWYATHSDGLLHAVDTPYGRISGAICFDLDFPALIRQAAVQEVDILLVPGFDTYLTRLYHTEVGLLRGVEGGFSVMRMVNEGTSMAVDYRGTRLASQDFFTTPTRVMIADLPSRGVATLYGRLGDYFAGLCIALAVGLVLVSVLRPAKVGGLEPAPSAEATKV